MITTILADDDKMALEYLESLINWESYGFQIVGRALDGDEALKLYNKHFPQLIVTDLRMPAMDGITLAEKVREQNADTRIIFLSGYQEFEYVRAALHMGVDDYILKHELDEKMLLEKLMAVKRELKADEYNTRLAVGKIIIDFLERNTELPKQKDNSVFKLLERKYHMILLEKDDVLPPLAKYLNIKEPLKFLNEIVCEFFSEYGIQAVPIKIKTYRALIMIPAENDISLKKSRDKIYEYTKKLSTYLTQQTGEEFSMILMSEPCIPNELSGYWSNLNSSMGIARLRHANFCVFFDDVKQCAAPKEDVDLAGIKSALLNGNCIELEKILNANIDYFGKNNDAVFALSFCEKCLELSISAGGSTVDLKSGGCISPLTLPENMQEATLRQTMTWKGLAEWIKEQMIVLCTVINKNHNLNYPACVLKGIDYISKNYSRNELSVEEIAEEAGKGRNRFGLLFKEKTGQTISDYLTCFRIQKSQEMIRSGKYKMYEIAELSGYTTSQYFSKVFKKVMGITPYEYKKECEEGR